MQEPSQISATNVRYGSGRTIPCSASKARTASHPSGSPSGKAARRAARSSGPAWSVFTDTMITPRRDR
ncbi:hypothetical protein ACFQ0B_58420 [Nonomuraea thailandensis]